MSKEPILKVKDLGISFSQYTNGLVRGDLNEFRYRIIWGWNFGSCGI